MEITKRESATKISVKKSFSQDELAKLEKSVLQTEAHNFKFPGFRQGKAPLDKVREKLIESGQWVEALNLALQRSFLFDWDEKMATVEGDMIRIFDFKSAGENPLAIEFVCEIFPRLKKENLKKVYEKIEIGEKKKDFKVEEKEIDNTLKELQKRRTVLQPFDGAAEKGKDVFLKISVAGTDKFIQDVLHCGQDRLGKEIEKTVLGMKEGDEKTVKVTFDKETLEKSPQLAPLELKTNEEAELVVKAEKIFSADEPKLDDEFAKSLGDFKDLKDLRKKLEEGILLEKQQQEKDRRREALALFLLEKIELEVPASIVERNLEEEKKRLEEYLSKQEEKKQQEIIEGVEKRLKDEIKLQRIIETIALEEKIIPSEKEIEEETNRILSQYRSKDEAEKALGQVEDFKSRVLLSLTYQKTFDYLEKINKIAEDLKL